MDVEPPLQPLRTVVAALAGAVLGAALVGYAAGQVVELAATGDGGSWAALGAAVAGAAVGAFLGAGVALALAFRGEPARTRWTTVLTTVLGGPVLLLAVGAAASRLDADWNVPPLWVVATVAAAALAGRWLALAADRRRAHDRGRR